MSSMCFFNCFLFLALVYGVSSKDHQNVLESQVCFTNGFMFGVATSAYQIEGAWNVSGKGESIWDRYTHEHPDRIFDHQNGDIAEGSYYKVKEDVSLMKQLGINFHRFSMSWPRILPDGLSNNVNEDGIRHYKEFLHELKRNNITPVVTMYHWDLPQNLQELGGWTNPIMADYFTDYARVLFNNFGDQVKFWITFNEPVSFCQFGYGGGFFAPGHMSSGFEDYMCGHNVLRAHGMVYSMFDKEFREKIGGYVGITIAYNWVEPATTAAADEEAAETARQFTFGWFAHPIYSKAGDYPPLMRRVIDANSKRQGFSRSRLPYFTREEVKMIRGAYDFLGMNHYTTRLAQPGSNEIKSTPSYEDDMNVNTYQKEDWPSTNSSWLKVVPWGFRKSLNYVKLHYKNPQILVTENGVSYEPGLHDTKRVHFIDAYLRSLHSAVYKDGCRVIGYTYWTLMDDYEWSSGFSERFGLYEVDYKSPNLTRTPRLSAKFFSKIAKTGCLPNNFAEGSESTDNHFL